ncbi:unnamed protein product [Caenorhabditis brenneri]
MFKQTFILLAAFAIIAFSAKTEEEAINELKSAGMSENAINSLVDLEREFKEQYLTVAGNKEAAVKYAADFSAKTQNVISSMSSEDQTAYNNYIKKPQSE